MFTELEILAMNADMFPYCHMFQATSISGSIYIYSFNQDKVPIYYDLKNLLFNNNDFRSECWYILTPPLQVSMSSSKLVSLSQNF